MEKPCHDNIDDASAWFCLMVLHQNRADRGPKNYLPEEILPEFLDLVIWGHEHDCRIDPEQCATKKIFVSQPGLMHLIFFDFTQTNIFLNRLICGN